MYLRSQNGEKIVVLCELMIWVDAEGHFDIVHNGPGELRTQIVMAQYSTIDRAKQELDAIVSVINQSTKFYKFTEE